MILMLQIFCLVSNGLRYSGNVYVAEHLFEVHCTFIAEKCCALMTPTDIRAFIYQHNTRPVAGQ